VELTPSLQVSAVFEAPSIVFTAAGIAVFIAAVLPKLLRNALELFFDLVFVYAMSQVTRLMLTDTS
jgi:hypothetical protein